MIGAGTFINPLIKVLTTVAILAAIYFFILKPALDFGSDVSDDVSSGFDQIERVQRIAERNGVESFDAPFGLESQKQGRKLLDCVQRAQPDTTRMQACAERFRP